MEIKKEVGLQILASVLIACFSGTSGYWYGISTKRAKGWKGLLETCAGKNSLMSKYGEDVIAYDRDRNPASISPDAVYYAILEKNHLEERHRKLSSIFPTSDLGRSLTHLATLVEFAPGEDSPEGAVLLEEIKFLESQPHEVFSLIRSQVKKLGVEYENEHQYLVQFVVDLDIEVSEKVDFLTEELTKQNSSDVHFNKFNSLVALSALMRLGVDATSLETAMRQFIAHQLSYSSRLLLLEVYESKYPEQARRIKDDFGI